MQSFTPISIESFQMTDFYLKVSVNTKENVNFPALITFWLDDFEEYLDLIPGYMDQYVCEKTMSGADIEFKYDGMNYNKAASDSKDNGLMMNFVKNNFVKAINRLN